MKNLITVTSLGETRCPTRLHDEYLQAHFSTYATPLAALDPTDEKQYGTILHAYVEAILTSRRIYFKYPKIRDEAYEYIAWLKKTVKNLKAADIEKPIEIEIFDEYMPTARLAGRPDFATFEDGKLIIVDWKKAGHIPGDLMQVYIYKAKAYACLKLVKSGKFLDTDIHIYNGADTYIHLSAEEIMNFWHEICDICTAAVANTSPTKPYSSCVNCCKCDSIQNFLQEWEHRYWRDDVRLGLYWDAINFMHNKRDDEMKAAGIAGKIPTAAVSKAPVYQSSKKAVKIMKTHNPDLVTVKESVTAEHARATFTEAELEECMTGTQTKIKYNKNLKWKY